jgi:hypothetical protein
MPSPGKSFDKHRQLAKPVVIVVATLAAIAALLASVLLILFRKYRCNRQAADVSDACKEKGGQVFTPRPTLSSTVESPICFFCAS